MIGRLAFLTLFFAAPAAIAEPTATAASIPATPTHSAARSSTQGGTTSVFGWLFLLAGLGLIAFSFLYQPTVNTDDVTSGLGVSAYSAPSDVYNFGKLNIQLMLCITGAAFLMSGSVLIRSKA